MKKNFDHSIVTTWLKKFCSDWKNLVNQAKSGESKTVAFEALLLAIKVNPESNSLRKLDKFSIWHSSVACQIYDFGKSI